MVVFNKKKIHKFDSLIEKLYDVDVADISVVEDYSINTSEEQKLDLEQDTLTIINNEIDYLDTDGNANDLKEIIRNLYMESLTNGTK